VSVKPKCVGTRSPISTNAPDCILFTRLDETGGIEEPEVRADLLVRRGDFFLVDGSMLTWSRSEGEVKEEIFEQT